MPVVTNTTHKASTKDAIDFIINIRVQIYISYQCCAIYNAFSARIPKFVLNLYKMAEAIVPVSVYVEMTPNPATMKFVANKYLISNGDQAEFNSIEEARNNSPLAEQLFQFPFVERVFLASNFVAITKNESIQWDFVTMELREFVKSFVEAGNVALLKVPETKAKPEAEKKRDIQPSEYDEVIKGLLEEYVRPAVENDGGAINYVSYDNGIVTVELKGACSGCPSSTMTLRGGIENLLKQHIPDVRAVVAEEG